MEACVSPGRRFLMQACILRQTFQTWVPKAEPSSLPECKGSYAKALIMNSCMVSFSQWDI